MPSAAPVMTQSGRRDLPSAHSPFRFAPFLIGSLRCNPWCRSRGRRRRRRRGCRSIFRRATGPPAVELLRSLGVGDVPGGIDQLFVHVIFEPAPDTTPPCRDPHGMGPAHRRDRRTSCIRYATGSGIHRGYTPAMQGAPKVDVHAGPMNENRSQEAVPSHSEAVTRRQRARRRVKRVTTGIAGVAMAVTDGTAGLAAADRPRPRPRRPPSDPVGQDSPVGNNVVRRVVVRNVVRHVGSSIPRRADPRHVHRPPE